MVFRRRENLVAYERVFEGFFLYASRRMYNWGGFFPGRMMMM